jgi:hypothetical protein
MIRTPGVKEERALQTQIRSLSSGLKPGGRRFKSGSRQLLANHVNFNGALIRSIDQFTVGATLIIDSSGRARLRDYWTGDRGCFSTFI